jgi:DNA-binding XRE family transcriptional regulator
VRRNFFRLPLPIALHYVWRMDLKTYLESNAIRQVAFAKLCGVTGASISRIISGDQLPSLALALKIERLTAGAVPCSIWEDAAA